MKNGSFDIVKGDDLRAEEWEIAPNAPDRCNILHVFLSSMTDEEKDLIITLCVISFSLMPTQSHQSSVLFNVNHNKNKGSQ